MSALLTETADYDEPGSWGRMSVGWPEVRGDRAYDLYVFSTQTGIIPYGSYVLVAHAGHYGDTESLFRAHAEHMPSLQAEFDAAGCPSATESIRRRKESGKPYAPHWWKT